MKRFILSILAALTLTAPAFAASRLDCTTGGNASSYHSGKRVGANAVNFLWTRFGNEYDMEAFFGSVAGSIRFSPATSSFVECGNLGYADGVWEEVDRIRDQTSNNCLNSGASLGEMNGRLACGVVCAPEVESPRGVCTSNQQMACSTALRNFVNRNCRGALTPSELDQFVMQACQSR